MPRYHSYARNRRPDALALALMSKPSSCMSRVVFAWDRQCKRFTTTEFNPVATEGRLYQQDLDRVLNQLQTCPNYVPKNPWICLVLVWPLGCFLSVTILNLLVAYTDNSSKSSSGSQSNQASYTWIFLILYLIAIIGSTAFPIIYFIKKNKQSLLDREKEFSMILEKENQTFLRGKDMRWTVGKFGAWLSLELDYILRHMNQNVISAGQPVQGPPMGMGNQYPAYNMPVYPQAPANDGYMNAKY